MRHRRCRRPLRVSLGRYPLPAPLRLTVLALARTANRCLSVVSESRPRALLRLSMPPQVLMKISLLLTVTGSLRYRHPS